MKTNTLDFDAQALRERILDLAMRGKLVPQDPNDEPASVLLEKIKAEKAELVKEKKIKKTKALPEITDDEKPFDIPDSWEWVRLGEVSILKNGKTPRKKDISNDGIYPYFKVKDMNNNELYMEKIQNFVGKEYQKQTMPKNTIIFPKNGGAVLTAKKRILIQDSLVDLNTGGIIPYKNSNFKYIFYLFSSLNIKNYVKGSAVPTINSKKLKETLVPLPPLSEQSRIAAKIAQLFALLRKVELSTQQYAELQTLLKSKVLDLAMRGKLVKQDPNDEPASVLLEKIKAEKAELVKEKKIKKSKPLPPITDEEKPFDIPDSWEWVRARDLTSRIGDGLHGTPRFSKEGYAFINGSNLINTGVQITDNTKFVDKVEYLKYKPVLEEGTIFISLNGTLGKVALYNNEKIILGKSAGYFNLINPQMKLYFMYYLKSSIFKKFYNKKYTGSVIKNIPLSALREAPIPVPPIKEQLKIVDRIKQIFSLIN